VPKPSVSHQSVHTHPAPRSPHESIDRARQVRTAPFAHAHTYHTTFRVAPAPPSPDHTLPPRIHHHARAAPTSPNVAPCPTSSDTARANDLYTVAPLSPLPPHIPMIAPPPPASPIPHRRHRHFHWPPPQPRTSRVAIAVAHTPHTHTHTRCIRQAAVKPRCHHPLIGNPCTHARPRPLELARGRRVLFSARSTCMSADVRARTHTSASRAL